jgi:hypothetical protein
MRTCEPLLLILGQAMSRRLVVVTLEHEIIAEGKPLPRPMCALNLSINAADDAYENFDVRHPSVSADIG